MYYMRLLVLLALQVTLVHCFSWDIVVGIEKRLEFYYNGTLTHTEDIPWAKDIKSTTYDPVDYRIIFADNNNPKVSISSFDISTRKIQHLVTGTITDDSVRVAYDPVTQLLFWKSDYEIYSFPLNPVSSNKAVDGNQIIRVATTNMYCLDIAIDSCGGYVYWVTDDEIERAQFDGSERETLIKKHVFWRLSLVIDQQTKKMYWIEKTMTNGDYQLFIKSADFYGKHATTLYVIKNETKVKSLAVSKDFIYWRGDDGKAIWQLPKNPSQGVEAKLFSSYHTESCFDCQHIAAYYTIKEQTEGNQNCKNLKSLIPNYSAPDLTDVSVLCFHGKKVSGETRCECTQGYTGDKCEVSICQNYCMQGNCSVNAEGQPECRCNAGFSGERCEVSACHKHCLNNGVCSLNEEDEPVCQCTAGYDGERCDVPAVVMKCIQFVSMLKNMLNPDTMPATLGNGESSCASNVV